MLDLPLPLFGSCINLFESLFNLIFNLKIRSPRRNFGPVYPRMEIFELFCHVQFVSSQQSLVSHFNVLINYYFPFSIECVIAGCDEQNCDTQNNDEVLRENSEEPSKDCQKNETVDLNDSENRCKFYDIG